MSAVLSGTLSGSCLCIFSVKRKYIKFLSSEIYIVGILPYNVGVQDVDF